MRMKGWQEGTHLLFHVSPYQQKRVTCDDHWSFRWRG